MAKYSDLTNEQLGKLLVEYAQSSTLGYPSAHDATELCFEVGSRLQGQDVGSEVKNGPLMTTLRQPDIRAWLGNLNWLLGFYAGKTDAPLPKAVSDTMEAIAWAAGEEVERGN